MDLWNIVNDLNINYSIDLSLKPINSQHSGGDMLSFWNNGFVGTSFAENDYNPYYHSTHDLIKYINFDYLLQNAKISATLLLEISNNGIVSSIEDEDIQIDDNLISPNPAGDYIVIKLERWSPPSRWTP
ncbi:MAG: Zn-dependent exopeptidase M28, partial [Chloroflexia bacterium]|nr:Zn-dependent exopeptidase M28 [Chloroflexia bacterium]